MATEKKNNAGGGHGGHGGLTFGERLIAGGTAGIIECLIMYPLDVVKTLQQIKVGQGQGTFTLLRDLLKGEGFGIYRGIAAPLLMETPKRAIKFTANETFQPYLANSQGKLSQNGAIVAGIGAGVTEAFVIVPFELVKIRMQARDNVGKYLNTADAVLKIARTEGPMTFYKGLESTLWRNGVWNGSYFGIIHWLKHTFPVQDERSGSAALRNFMAGVLGGAIATTFNTPFDVVKSRIQNQANSAAAWSLPELVRVGSTEGVTALYKGYLPKLLRLGPGGGVLYVVFEYMSNWLKSRRQNH
jgi:solute carrier family 25 2-oxodicarboxylate transporter 21